MAYFLKTTDTLSIFEHQDILTTFYNACVMVGRTYQIRDRKDKVAC